MGALTLVTHTPTAQDPADKAGWANALEHVSQQAPVYVWHTQAIDENSFTDHTNPEAIHHQIKSPLWHEDVLRNHWAGLTQQTCEQRLIHLQALGLVHDAALTNPFDATLFVWLSPQWLASLGSLAGDFVMRLEQCFAHTERCIYARARHFDGFNPRSDGSHYLDLLIAPNAVLSQINAHYWQHFGHSIEHNTMPSPQGLLEQASIDLASMLGWLPLDADGHPGALLHPGPNSGLFIHRHQVLIRG